MLEAVQDQSLAKSFQLGLGVTPEEAAAERVRREMARRSLAEFGQYVLPWWKLVRMQSLICEYLEKVETYIRTEGASGISRLMVLAPPQEGKTWSVSRLFPAWLLGRNPNKHVILTSYGAELASKNSQEVRSIVTGKKFGAIFGERSVIDEPVALSDDSRAKSNWDLADPHKGGVVSAGVGGGLTGNPGDLIVIDDPYKNREEAESEARQELVKNWYQSSVYTRQGKHSAIVIMQTRWNREDLIGQLLRQMVTDPLADQWVVLCLPALAMEPGDYAKNAEDQRAAMAYGIYLDTKDPLDRQPGQALFPERHDVGYLQKVRAAVGEYDWWSLYQQQPRPAEGGFFNEKDFTIVERGEVPEGLQWFRYVDLALGEKTTSDWNACLACALDEKSGDVYYRDLLYVHELTEFCEQMATWMTLPTEIGTRWGLEDVAFQSLVFKDLQKDSRLAATAFEPIRPEGDKVARARAIQARARQGKIKLVRGEWNITFIREALDFPKGRHDDIVDTASGGLQMIAQGSSSGIYL